MKYFRSVQSIIQVQSCLINGFSLPLKLELWLIFAVHNSGTAMDPHSTFKVWMSGAGGGRKKTARAPRISANRLEFSKNPIINLRKLLRIEAKLSRVLESGFSFQDNINQTTVLWNSENNVCQMRRDKDQKICSICLISWAGMGGGGGRRGGGSRCHLGRKIDNILQRLA